MKKTLSLDGLTIELDILAEQEAIKEMRVGMTNAAKVTKVSRRRIQYWTKMGYFSCKSPPYEYTLEDLKKIYFFNQLFNKGFKRYVANQICENYLKNI